MMTKLHKPEKTYIQANISAVILAGGKGTRLAGQDKGLIAFEGEPVIARIIEQISPQVSETFISANRNHSSYEKFGLPVIADGMQGYLGPLAGILTALESIDNRYLVTLPCDAPLLAVDLVERLATAMAQENAEIAVAHDGARMQHVYMLIPKLLVNDLQNFLDTGGRAVKTWLATHNIALADFSDCVEIFTNFNTSEDLQVLWQIQKK